MRVTRHNIKKEVKRVNAYFCEQAKLGPKSVLFTIAQQTCRGNFTLRYDNRASLLKNVLFLFNNTDCHWAETDGTSIWLNTYKEFTSELLYKTLLHEALHGMIVRKNGSELSEHLEHKIMEDLDPSLI